MNYPEYLNSIRRPAVRLFEAAAGLVFPANIYCICCGDVMSQKRVYGLCDKCTEDISWLAKRIEKTDYDSMAFDNAYSVCSYDLYSKKIIYRLKFGSAGYMSDNLGRLMAETYMAQESFDHNALVVPVPMHPEKIKQRGYNQAALLARAFAKHSGLEYADALSKIKMTASMRTARQVGRARILENSIAVREGFDPSGLSFVLIDDVMTTGATANVCAEALRSQGALNIDFVSFAAVGERTDAAAL